MKIKKKNLILSTLFIFIGLTGFISAQTYDCPMGGYGGMMSGGYGFGGAAFGWIFSILIIVVLILLIFWLIKQIQKPSKR